MKCVNREIAHRKLYKFDVFYDGDWQEKISVIAKNRKEAKKVIIDRARRSLIVCETKGE